MAKQLLFKPRYLGVESRGLLGYDLKVAGLMQMRACCCCFCLMCAERQRLCGGHKLGHLQLKQLLCYILQPDMILHVCACRRLTLSTAAFALLLAGGTTLNVSQHRAGTAAVKEHAAATQLSIASAMPDTRLGCQLCSVVVMQKTG